MARPFQKLLARMVEMGIDQEHLGRELLLSKDSVSQRFSGRIEWKLSEIWQVMKLLDIDPRRMAQYFSEGGKNDEQVSRPSRGRRMDASAPDRQTERAS